MTCAYGGKPAAEAYVEEAITMCEMATCDGDAAVTTRTADENYALNARCVAD